MEPTREDEQEFGESLASTDAQAALFTTAAVEQYAESEAQAHAHSTQADATVERTVPTEFLQDGAGVTLELPPMTRAPSLVALVVAFRPKLVVLLVVVLATLATVSLATSSLNLSVSSELLEASEDQLVLRHASAERLDDFSALRQLEEHEALGADDFPNEADESGRRRLRLRSRRVGCARSDERQAVKLLYESLDERSIFEPEALQAIWAAESELRKFVEKERVCWADDNCECMPFDGAAPYLFPSRPMSRPYESSEPELVLDGAGPVSPPPICSLSYSQATLEPMLQWLHASGKAALVDGPTAEGSTARGGARGHSAGSAREPPAHSRYTRTFAYLSRPRWRAAVERDAKLPARLRALLDGTAASLPVHMYVEAGPDDDDELVTAEQLVWIYQDAWLVGLAVLAITAYMRLRTHQPLKLVTTRPASHPDALGDGRLLVRRLST
jgi:hypothetical protein